MPPFLALLGLQSKANKPTGVSPVLVFPLSMQSQSLEAPLHHANSKTVGSLTCSVVYLDICVLVEMIWRGLSPVAHAVTVGLCMKN